MVVSPSKISRKSVFAQGDHAQFDGLLSDDNRRRTLIDKEADGVGGDQEFENAAAALVAGVVAVGAAAAVVKNLVADVVRREVEQGKLAFGRLEWGAALFADGADEALGQDGHQGGGDEERLHAHVNQAGDGAGGVIGVKGAQDQVAGEGGLDGDLGGLQVAHFPQHDDVGVLAEEGAQGVAEGHADGFVDGDLHDAFDVIFHRVFDGEEFGCRWC